MWGAAKASSLTKSSLAALVKCSSLDVLTSSSLLRWADIRLTSWSVLILSNTRLDSFRVWKKCQRSEEGQSTKVENELHKRVLVTKGPALTPGGHKHWSHPCSALTFHMWWEVFLGMFSQARVSLHSDRANNSKEATPACTYQLGCSVL